VNLVKQIYKHYNARTASGGTNSVRVPLPNYNDLNRSVLRDLLDPQDGLPYDARAVLRTQLRLAPETNAPAASPAAVSAPSNAAAH
jgi:hypothetical protein